MISKLTGLVLFGALASCGSQADTAGQQRYPDSHPAYADDPSTTNVESNDQSLGYYGTRTLCVTNHGSGNSYPLDADMDGLEVITIYFQKGGNVDFDGCELDDRLEGECEDDEGRGWSFAGEC